MTVLWINFLYMNLLFSYTELIKFSSPEAATGGVLYEKLFLEISQNSQKAPVLESFF